MSRLIQPGPTGLHRYAARRVRSVQTAYKPSAVFPPTSPRTRRLSAMRGVKENEKRDSPGDFRRNGRKFRLSLQAAVSYIQSTLARRVSIFLTLLVSLLAGFSMPAEARILLPERNAAGNLTSHTTRDADGLPLDTFGTATGPYGPNGKWQEPSGLVNDGKN